MDVVVTHCESWRIEKEGGPYANELEVILPRGSRGKLLEVIKTLNPDNWKIDLDEGEDAYAGLTIIPGHTVTLSWD